MLPPLIDPWDPGLTARDLLFRGGCRYRKRPRVVLDVTEQPVPLGSWRRSLCAPGEADAGEFQAGGSGEPH
uniref:TATA-box binding protein associated factor, RNA polymerase I subunit C n=1 Tax=Homo sapiens TaxID=9606 RepID=H3BTQ6_HUMAN